LTSSVPFREILYEKNAGVAFTQDSNDMLEGLLKHLDATCVALRVLALTVQKTYLYPNEKKKGVRLSPSPIVPTCLSISLSPRLTSLTLTGFTFNLDNFEDFSFARLKNVHFEGVDAVAVTDALKARSDFPPDATIKGADADDE
jgi:hypothetical protein